MRVLLDANVIVAAFAARGLCEAVFEVCLDSHDIILSEELLAEINKNLQKKIKLPAPTTHSIVRLLRQNCLFHSPEAVSRTACRDPKDLHVLGLALAGNADVLVTGDKDLLILKQFQHSRILSPRQFSDLIHRENKDQ